MIHKWTIHRQQQKEIERGTDRPWGDIPNPPDLKEEPKVVELQNYNYRTRARRQSRLTVDTYNAPYYGSDGMRLPGVEPGLRGLQPRILPIEL